MVKKPSFRSMKVCVILVFLCLSMLALGTELTKKVEKAKAELQEGVNTWNAEKMKLAKDIFLNLLMMEESEKIYFHYYIALCDYRLATFFMTQNAIAETGEHTKNGLKHLEEAMKLDPSWGEPFALYASMLGYEIALDPAKGMTLGFKIFDYFGKAFEKESDNPRINLMKGLSDLFTPEQYGGGADVAIKSLTKAMGLFEKEKVENPIKPSWGKDEAYAFLGMAYNQKGDVKKAEEFFKKALDVNPELSLAREELKKIEKT